MEKSKRQENDLGPGSYIMSDSISIKKNNHPFNNSQTRDYSFSPRNDNPGVGTYILDISELKKDEQASSFFKNKIDRFNDISYQKDISKPQIQYSASISSIPSLITKNVDYINLQKSLIKEFIPTENFQIKEPKFFQNIKNETSEDIGPGTYSTDVSQNYFHQRQQSSQFRSQTQRNLHSNYGQIKNQVYLDRLKNQASLLAQNQQELDQIISFDKLSQNKSPGPGSYNLNQQKTIKKDKYFGTSEQRFPSIKPYYQQIIPEESQNDYKNFNSTIGKSERFDQKKKIETPGPASYQLQHSINDKLKKMKRNKQFIEQYDKFIEDTPGPGHYQRLQDQSNSDKIDYFFASKCKQNDYHQNCKKLFKRNY